MVITARNPVHSVLFLILAFFNAAGIFVLLGAEFLAMILIIVHVGAVTVLFLFVVMMLDVDFSTLRKRSVSYIFPSIILGGILLFELVIIYTYWYMAPEALTNIAQDQSAFEGLSNTQALGMVLYTDYVFAFQMAGLILLVAMVGATVLTLRKRPDIHKQRLHDQYLRKPSDVLEITRVTPKTGV